MSLLDEITLDDLDPEQRELAECIGLEPYKKLLKNYAGSPIVIRMPQRVTMPLRNKAIRKKFNGYNYRELAKEYDLSEASIRKIVSSEIIRVKNEPFEGQISLFEKI